jgi:hypothetical protein
MLSKRILGYVPYLGMISFIILCIYAAHLYPGGTTFDHEASGYSLVYNFVCDLFRSTGYSGTPNPGRPFAIAGWIILSVSMGVFWYFVPNLFKEDSRKSSFIRVTGPLSMLMGILVFTSKHHFSIISGTAFGLIAFVTTLLGLKESRRLVLFRFSLVALFFS